MEDKSNIHKYLKHLNTNLSYKLIILKPKPNFIRTTNHS